MASEIIKLPEILWRQIFKYMTIGDFHNILLVCRKLRSYTENYSEIFERECLRLFTSDLSLFELESSRTGSMFALAPGIPNWKKIMRKGGLLTQEWKSVGPVEGIKDAAFSAILVDLLTSLRDPNLPTPELYRDEFNAYKKTILQEHLYEFIFKEGQSSSTQGSSLSLEDMPPLGPPSKSEEPDLLQELGQMAWLLAAQCKTAREKEAFLSLRWYRLPQKSKVPVLKKSSYESLTIPSTISKYSFSNFLKNDTEDTLLIVTLLKLLKNSEL